MIFAALFLALALVHLRMMFIEIGPFDLTIPDFDGDIKFFNVPFLQTCRTFKTELNNQIDRMNASNRMSNLLSLLGYFAASATAFFSYRLAGKER